MTPGGFLPAVDVVGDYLSQMERRKVLIDQLCEALRAFLSDGVEQAIEQAKQHRAYRPQRPTIEDLNAAQEELDAAQTAIEGVERLADTMPEDVGEAFLASQRPALDRAIKPLEQRVAAIQKAMEEPEPEPGSPWDGSHRLGCMCTGCAKESGLEAANPQTLNLRLKESGWGRNADGDHICPSCLAKQNAAALSDASNSLRGPYQPKGESD
jgi:hypothetical protein